MQMVALGLYGLDSDDIDSTLKDKMRRLISSDTDMCEFEFIIQSRDGNTRLESSLKDHKISLSENGKVKPPTYVQDHFKILFDVPEEPTKKLISALRSIDYHLGQYELYVQRYRGCIKESLDKIDDYVDKENRLQEEAQALALKNTELGNLQKRLESVQEDYSKMEKAYVVGLHKRLFYDLTELDNQKGELNKRIKQLKEAGAGGGNRKYVERLKMFGEVLSTLKHSVNTSSSINDFQDEDDKKRNLSVAKEINDVFMPRKISDEKQKGWRTFYVDTLRTLESNPLQKKKMPEEEQIELLDRLIELLKDFVNMSTEIPGTNGKNVNEFLKELESSRGKSKSRISEKVSLNEAIKACKEIIANLDTFAEVTAQIPKEVAGEDDLDQADEDLKNAKRKYDNKLKEFTNLLGQYNAIPEREKVDLLSTKELSVHDYESKRKEKTDLDSKVRNCLITIESKRQLVNDLSKSKKPSGSLDKEKLKSAYAATDEIMRKIHLWKDYISSLDLEKMSFKKSPDLEAVKFYGALGDYFADVLKVVYFENRGWNVRQIDFMNRRYIVEARSPISFIDIGTGHTALNALLARMKQDYGGKKKILLFDEIGIMDAGNMGRLLEEIGRQVKSNEVLFALLSQVDNELNRPELVPVKLE